MHPGIVPQGASVFPAGPLAPVTTGELAEVLQPAAQTISESTGHQVDPLPPPNPFANVGW